MLSDYFMHFVKIYEKMVFSEEDKISIIFLWQDKHYGAKMFMKIFPDEVWTLGGQKKLMREIDLTES